ncbi:flagellar hook-length control protein FliK [Chitinivorax sp. B]|uniref:flagellar hook-length control protein FliK n=1 Tax=Chitinivorax sp. B TaxID=2502235 RepID=UPI001485A714|nr:flagellar hook-length control protein FliK [Chitinivorax sp. B]
MDGAAGLLGGPDFGAALQMALRQMPVALGLQGPLVSNVVIDKQWSEKESSSSIDAAANPLLAALMAQFQPMSQPYVDRVDALPATVQAELSDLPSTTDHTFTLVVDSLAMEDAAVQRKILPDAGEQGSGFQESLNQSQAMLGAQVTQRSEIGGIKMGPQVLSVAAPIADQQGWSKELGQNLIWLAGQKNQIAEMQLNPPQLGPLEVRVTIQNDQANLLFVSPHPSVREVIESALPRLSSMFAESGIAMGNVHVGGQSLADQRQHGQDQSRRGTGHREEAEVEPLWQAATLPWGISILA